MRPAHYSTAVNLEVGSNAIPGIGDGTSIDSKFATIQGSNVRRNGSLVTLDYTDVLHTFQPYAGSGTLLMNLAHEIGVNKCRDRKSVV